MGLFFNLNRFTAPVFLGFVLSGSAHAVESPGCDPSLVPGVQGVLSAFNESIPPTPAARGADYYPSIFREEAFKAKNPRYRVFTESGRSDFEVKPVEGRLFGKDKQPLSTWSNGALRDAIFIVTTRGELYVSKGFRLGELDQASLAGKNPLALAGTIRLQKGKIQSLHLESSSYVSSPSQLFRFLERLENRHFNVSQMKVTIAGAVTSPIKKDMLSSKDFISLYLKIKRPLQVIRWGNVNDAFAELNKLLMNKSALQREIIEGEFKRMLISSSAQERVRAAKLLEATDLLRAGSRQTELLMELLNTDLLVGYHAADSKSVKFFFEEGARRLELLAHDFSGRYWDGPMIDPFFNSLAETQFTASTNAPAEQDALLNAFFSGTKKAERQKALSNRFKELPARAQNVLRKFLPE